MKPASRHSPITDPDAEATLETLRLLAAKPELSQRQLSKALGLSLGKTHYVLHALLDKGLVKIENFSRSNNKLAYAYLLTPSGIAAKSRLTRAFLKFKMRQFEALRSEIECLRSETAGTAARARGATTAPPARQLPTVQAPIDREQKR